MNDKMKELLERQKNGDGNIVTAMVVTDLEGNGEIFMDASTDHWQVVASLLAYGVQKAMRFEANGFLRTPAKPEPVELDASGRDKEWLN